MRVIQVFGQHIDLDTIVAITEWDLPEFGDFEMGERMDFSHGLRRHKVSVCELTVMLRDKPIILWAPWPNIDEFTTQKAPFSIDRDGYIAEQQRIYTSIKADYAKLLQRWKDQPRPALYVEKD